MLEGDIVGHEEVGLQAPGVLSRAVTHTACPRLARTTLTSTFNFKPKLETTLSTFANYLKAESFQGFMTDIMTLREIVEDGRLTLGRDQELVERDIAGTLLTRAKYGVIEVITGVRRSGKSTLLLWVGRKLIARGKKVHYINFEDDRFMPEAGDLHNIATLMDLEDAVLLVDEPQNMPNWEKWVRRLHDRGVKIYVTGSNSGLLGSEFATALTGRKMEHEVFPFSYTEFMRGKGADALPSDQNQRMFEDFMVNGGFPYSVMSGDISVLPEYRRDIIERDILSRHRIRDVNTFRNLYRFVMSNPGLYISGKSVKGFLDISHVTLRKYMEYMTEAYAVIPLEKFSYSQKEQILNPKKYYPVDNGLLIKRTDMGKLLESCIVQHIKRHVRDVYYWKDKGSREVDIYLPGRNIAIQITYELNSGNLSREESALASAIEEFGAEPMIITSYPEAKTQYPVIKATEFIQKLPSIIG
jgi:hypothetical protein